MKKILSALVTGCFLALLMTVSVHAQMPGTEMRVNIPFDFMVRGRALPAGDYEVRRISDSPDGLVIQNINDKRENVIFETDSVELNRIARRSEVVFNRYGDSYFLSEVVTAGEQTNRELAPTRSERQLRHEMETASNTVGPERVVLASN